MHSLSTFCELQASRLRDCQDIIFPARASATNSLIFVRAIAREEEIKGGLYELPTQPGGDLVKGTMDRGELRRKRRTEPMSYDIPQVANGICSSRVQNRPRATLYLRDRKQMCPRSQGSVTRDDVSVTLASAPYPSTTAKHTGADMHLTSRLTPVRKWICSCYRVHSRPEVCKQRGKIPGRNIEPSYRSR